MRKIVCVFIAVWFVLAQGCAGGDIDENSGEDNHVRTNAPENVQEPENEDAGLNQNQVPNQNQTPNQNQVPNQNQAPNQNQVPNQDAGVPNQNQDTSPDGDPCDGVQCGPDEQCDPVTGACVGCLDDGDCSPDGVCDQAVQECVECIDDGDCEDGEECDGSSQQCTMIGECIDETDCPEPELCDPNGYECVECIDSGDCGGDVCEPTYQECVECLGETDCDPELVCDETGHTCVECVDGSDCDSDECHPEFAVCRASCCEFVVETTGKEVKAYFRGYGMALDGQEDLHVGIADEENDQIVIHKNSGGDWSYIVVDNVSFSNNIPTLDIAIADDDEPHLIFGNSSTITHYWHEEGEWWWEQIESESFRQVGAGSDAEGGVHFIGNRFAFGTLYYYWWDESGNRGTDHVEMGSGANIEHARIAVRANGDVVVAALMSDDSVRIAERIGGDWQPVEQIGDSGDSFTDVDIALDVDETPVVATSQDDEAELWRRDAGVWKGETVTVGQERGDQVRLDIDGMGEPHLMYAASGTFDDEMYYARNESGQWSDYELGEFYSDHWAFVVEEDGRPHGAARGSAIAALFDYVTTE